MDYDEAKHNVRRAFHQACYEANKLVYKDMDQNSSGVYQLARQVRRENVDVVGEKPLRNDAGEL